MTWLLPTLMALMCGAGALMTQDTITVLLGITGLVGWGTVAILAAVQR